MLDLSRLAENFIKANFESFTCDNPEDETAIHAVIDINLALEDRQNKVLRWLHYYKVLLFFPPQNSQNIAAKIIEFADNRRETTLRQSKDAIIREYERLEAKISEVAPRSPRSGELREVVSLTSKALWCCYPHDVPIFDRYAQTALQVVSRISGLTPGPNQSKYATFLDVWFQLYKEIAPVIDQANLNGYTYKVRVLDRFLWYLGQPNFKR